MFVGIGQSTFLTLWRSSFRTNWRRVANVHKCNCRRYKELKMTSSTSPHTIRLLSQVEAQYIDEALMSDAYGYTLEQLMELAGLAVALAVVKECPRRDQKIVAVCGPGNNGGDGLVAARHLGIFGYESVHIVYPRRGGSSHFQRLVRQAQSHGVQFADESAFPQSIREAHVLIDAIFGFSFRADRPVRDPYASLIRLMNESPCAHTVVAVDIPSGWDVEHGPPPMVHRTGETENTPMVASQADLSAPKDRPAVEANVWVSLTAPKRCAAQWKGRAHYLGGRFVPPSLAQEMKLYPLPFTDTELIARIDDLLPRE